MRSIRNCFASHRGQPRLPLNVSLSDMSSNTVHGAHILILDKKVNKTLENTFKIIKVQTEGQAFSSNTGM